MHGVRTGTRIIERLSGQIPAHQERAPEPSTHFVYPEEVDDFAEVDPAVLTGVPVKSLEQAAEVLSLILSWCWSRGFKTAQRRFAALSAGLRPDLLNDRTFLEIGAELGCTKAAISKNARLFQEAFGFRFSRTRAEDSCARMREAQIGHPNYKMRPANQPTTPAA